MLGAGGVLLRAIATHFAENHAAKTSSHALDCDSQCTSPRKQYFIHGPFFFTSANRFLPLGHWKRRPASFAVHKWNYVALASGFWRPVVQRAVCRVASGPCVHSMIVFFSRCQPFEDLL